MTNIVQAMDQLQIKINQTVNEVAVDLYNELVRVTPVDTGQLRTSWTFEKTALGYLLSNNMQYASIIFEGRRIVAGKTYGSKQLPAGLDPILMKYNIILTNKLNKIKV